MTRIKALKDSIQQELQGATGIRFYSKAAPPLAKVPFGVFSLLLLRRGANADEYDLLVNIADSEKDEDRVETLAEKAAEHLDCLDYFAPGTSWACVLNNVQPIDHGDTTIQERRISCTIKYYRKE